MFAGIKIDKVALDIELKTEPKDDVSDHNSLGPDLPDHDDDMSMNMDDRGPDWPIDSKIFFSYSTYTKETSRWGRYIIHGGM